MPNAGADLPVALTTARCSRDASVLSALLLAMMSGPPMASSSGRFSFASAGFWLICSTKAHGASPSALENQIALRFILMARHE